ncbi:MAG: cupredoxin domain-containing protein [Candidatus Eremiobacteraeota bacterium]|nr:cupredoxin domain-containing protein [Candidatus Eremiobacteraeota bacterium]
MFPVLLPIVLATAYAMVADNAPDAVTITAVPSTFTPSSITLHRGVPAKLIFSHTEGVHEIESDELGIPKTILAPGKDVTIDVTPDKDGVYTLRCEIVCGPDHDKMALTVHVEG